MTNLVFLTRKVIGYLNKSYVFLVVILAILSYGYIIVVSSNIINEEPSEHKIYESTKSYKTPKIDERIINKIENMEDNSSTPEVKVNQNRTNPFE